MTLTSPGGIHERQWIVASLEHFVLLVSLGYAVLFIGLACLRAFYPFELEWTEGTVIDEVKWVAQGHPLYGAPSISFIPLIYGPLYFYLSAAVVKVIGIGFVGPRLISILATVASFLLLYLIVLKDSQHRLPGIVAAGTYAASFRFAGAWMDLAKTDSLALLLILTAFFVSRYYPNYRGLVGSGFAYVLAYFTKQIALPVVLVMTLVSLLESRGRTWLQWLFVGFVGFTLFWILDRTTDGWFSFYTVNILTYEGRVPDIWLFWRLFIPQMYPALVIGLCYPVLSWVGSRSTQVKVPEPLWQNLAFGLALFLASWSVFLKVWTYSNGFMLACAGSALGVGWGLDQAARLFRQPSARQWKEIVAYSSGLILVLLQFSVLYYNPLEQLPTSKDRDAASKFVQRLSELPGEVFVFNHGFVNYLAGKNTYLHSTTYGDVVAGVYPPRTDEDRRRIEMGQRVFQDAIRKQIFNWIVVDRPSTSWLPYYVYIDRIFDDPKVLLPLTGAPARPESLMIRNPVARGGRLALGDSALNFLFPEGWSAPETWGRWAVGQMSVVNVSLERNYQYQIQIEVSPVCSNQTVKPVMEVGWNEHQVGHVLFESCTKRSLMFEISSEWVTGELDQLWFEFPEATSAANAGILTEKRVPAAAFSAFTLVQNEVR